MGEVHMPSRSTVTGTANFCHSKKKIWYYINLVQGSAVKGALAVTLILFKITVLWYF